ncbi:hypothetical protein EJ110_NYTH18607 [Nymphaea thermarum]|nr:hypothetical protein EJ110_NYTH18607 [Nymphaea thermarum]
MAAMAFVAIARPYEPSGWVSVPYVEKDSHVQSLGEFAVTRYNEQTKGYLKFIQVTEAQVLDRGTEHYTYKLEINVEDSYGVKTFKSEVFQDLSAPGQPPVLNLGYFMPLSSHGALLSYPCDHGVDSNALVATAYPDHDEHHDVHDVEHLPFVPVPHAGMDVHVQQLGKFAVERFDVQTHAELKFIQVVEAEVFDRGTDHYTYHLLMKVRDGYDFKLYKCGVLQDLPGFEEPPVLNLGYFEPL